MKKRSILWAIFSRILGLFLFLIIVFLINILTYFISNPLYLRSVQFVNNNLYLLIIMSVFFLIGEMFYLLSFPFNLPAPLFSAAGAVLIAYFILKMFGFIDSILGTPIYSVFRIMSVFLYPIIFVVVIIAGYIGIISSSNKKRD